MKEVVVILLTGGLALILFAEAVKEVSQSVPSGPLIHTLKGVIYLVGMLAIIGMGVSIYGRIHQ